MVTTAIKKRRAWLSECNQQYGDTLAIVGREHWPLNQPAGLIEVWRSKRLLVLVFEPEAGATRLTVCRTQIATRGEWCEDISWQELQDAKREVGFGDREAVEVFPPDADVVNVANMRHLWVLSGRLPFSWRRERQPAPHEGRGEEGMD